MRYRTLKYLVIASALLFAACGRLDQANVPSGAAPTASAIPPVAVGGANALAGTRWQLAAIEQGGSSQPPLPGTQIGVAFEPGKLSGRSGCNSYGGDYKISGSTISVGELTQTLMGCEQAVMSQEAQFLNALKGATTFKIAGNELRIEYASGVLVFTAA